MLTHYFSPRAQISPLRNGGSFREYQRIRDEIDRLVGQVRYPMSAEFPPVNVWNNEHEAMVTAELPGFAVEDIGLSVSQNTLTLRGKRAKTELNEGATYHRQERWHGEFVRTLHLPFEVEADQVKAEFHDGLLSITLPRAEEYKPKKIALQIS